MPTLHLGVTDVPYSNGDKTTGDVAQILEDKYGVMQFFYDDVGEDAIASALEHSARDALEAVLMGAPASLSLTADAESEIETAFQHFLTQKEMDGRVPGVPTRAALAGVSARFKKGKGPGRPSFIDTGLYQKSFKAWVD